MGKGTLLVAGALDFAARKHAGQRRKGELREPYINHLAEVARLLAEATGGDDPQLVAAGLLHDTVEDTETTPQELHRAFGAAIASLVEEVTDDRSLERSVRRRLQVETAASKSPRARMIKIADKISNLRSLASSPPASWNLERRREYIEWARAVVERCRGVNGPLEREFDRALEQARERLRGG